MSANPTHYRVTNVCGTAHMSPCSPTGLNLQEIAAHPCFPNTVLTKRFAACHIMMKDVERNAKIVFLVFSSGVVNAVGAPSAERLRYWFRWLFCQINTHWAYAWKEDFRIRITMVAGVARLNRVFIPEVYMRHFGEDVSWEPERISALKKFYRNNPSKTTVQAFVRSVNFVSTGALTAQMGQQIAERFSNEVDRAFALEEVPPKTAESRQRGEPSQKRRKFFVGARRSRFSKGDMVAVPKKSVTRLYIK